MSFPPSMAASPAKPVGSLVRGHLTRAGWLFTVVACLLGAATVINPAALGFVIFGVLIGTLTTSIWLSRRMLSGKRECLPLLMWCTHFIE